MIKNNLSFFITKVQKVAGGFLAAGFFNLKHFQMFCVIIESNILGEIKLRYNGDILEAIRLSTDLNGRLFDYLSGRQIYIND